jgi:16S rRNA (adenine1518-N6/adenine1519-N6)-dimethyltransferase
MSSSLKTDLFFWLNKYNIKPNKDLGQCFLVDEKALNKIIAAADVHKGDKVLEVGPGTGILTEKLLQAGATVLAVEKDSRLVKILKARFGKEIKRKKLTLLSSDFLRLNFPDFLKKQRFAAGEYKVVANLPYQITSPVMERLLERSYLPALIVLTLQKEVAERICAKPGNLSSLAVLAQACARKCVLVSRFPKSRFYPQPEVDSALIKLEGLIYPDKIEVKKMRQIIHAGFARKRKKLKKNLSDAFNKNAVEKIWKKLDLPENIRAQELPIEKWVEIANTLSIIF